MSAIPRTFVLMEKFIILQEISSPQTSIMFAHPMVETFLNSFAIVEHTNDRKEYVVNDLRFIVLPECKDDKQC